jgi:hypothetical protein
MWYPGFGYTWVSGYPWGWTPYRSGSWMFLPTYGWLWQPGATGSGFVTIPKIVNPPARFVAPQPPTTPGKTQVVGPVVPVAPVSAGTVAIRQGSAGMGIPRGSIANLGKVQQQVERDGFVSARVKAVPVPVTSAPAVAGTKAAASTKAATPKTTTTAHPAPARTVTPMPRSTPHTRSAPTPRGTSPH